MLEIKSRHWTWVGPMCPKSKYDSSEIKEKDGKGNLPFKDSQVSFYIHIT